MDRDLLLQTGQHQLTLGLLLQRFLAMYSHASFSLIPLPAIFLVRVSDFLLHQLIFFFADEQEQALEAFGKCIFWFIFYHRVVEWPLMLDPLAFLIPFTASYNPYTDLEEEWFQDLHQPLVSLLHQTSLAVALSGTTDGTNAVQAIQQVLDSWTDGLEPTGEAVALFQCKKILRTVIHADKEAIQQLQGRTPLYT